MKSDAIGRILLTVILLLIAFAVLKWVISVALTLLNVAITIAVVVFVVWLLMSIFGKRRVY